MRNPLDQETEILTAFARWLDACESFQDINPLNDGYPVLVKAERENCGKLVSLPAPTAAAALAKLACLIELASDTFQDHEDHPAHLAIETLQEAAERLPVTAARSIRLALKGILLLSEGYQHAKTSPGPVLVTPATPTSPLPALYRRWVDLQARYCSGEGVDSRPEEAELEKALDDAEDRLALEPVRAPIDVIVKVAAFLSEAVRIDADEQVPIIDANSDVAWPRLIHITEAGVAIFEPDERAPVLALTKAVRDVVGIMEKADQERTRETLRLEKVRAVAPLVSSLEHPLLEAEGVADTLHLLGMAISDEEVANPVAYLANQLARHLDELRTMWATSVELLRQAEAGPC